MSENKVFDNKIKILGARVNNLKNIDVEIPKDKLVVVTGLSGSGKSSLAFNTIYTEGQRRYMETMSRYARQFLGNLERPDVDSISGLCPVIAIEQKTTNKNPRSTVGTITEIYDLLRLLYARIADAYSPISGLKMVKYTENKIFDMITQNYNNKSVYILSPLVKRRKGHYRELFEKFRKYGFTKVIIDGITTDLTIGLQIDRYKTHDIYLLIDKITINSNSSFRLKESIKTAFKYGKNTLVIKDSNTNEERVYSKNLVCPESGISFEDPEPNTFSFNSPYGACEKCNGLGKVKLIDISKILDLNKSIKKGGILPIGEYKNNWIFKQIELISKLYDFSLTTPLKDIPKEAIDSILYGKEEKFTVKNEYLGVNMDYDLNFKGIVDFIEEQAEGDNYISVKSWAHSFMKEEVCPKCKGTRLKEESLCFKINDKNIAELANMELSDLNDWLVDSFKNLSKPKQTISKEIYNEILKNLNFIIDVGLEYLSLNRTAPSLSGGESQRIRLATQIGSQLIGVLYILDEPSIGLHQRDNIKLIKSLEELRDLGNSILVMEHDEATMRAADEIIDMGPGAGRLGGYVVAQGKLEDIIKSDSLTGRYLSGKLSIEPPKVLREGNGKFIELKGACGNNLKNVDVTIPLNKLICVTGVSGSGKSSLINETLYPILVNHIYKSNRNCLPYKSITGLENIDKVIEIDQSPIGKSSRSNPATYTNVFTNIRKLFAELPQSKIRGYKMGTFSFNTSGGRCEVCKGTGEKVIEMNFLPSVSIHCEQCNGKRFKNETLQVRYKGKSIYDVLEMTINQSVEFFENIPTIVRKLKVLQDVGLGYLRLGQSSTTLSGGEAQRIKLVSELNKKDTGNTLYILDEPTTGLHFEDIKVLLNVLNRLANKGNTIIIIEHNLDVIRCADYIIDLGPEGGKNGGEIIATGTPEEIKKCGKGYTSKYI